MVAKLRFGFLHDRDNAAWRADRNDVSLHHLSVQWAVHLDVVSITHTAVLGVSASPTLAFLITE